MDDSAAKYGSQLLLDEDSLSEFLLTENDYPATFVHMAHPEDNTIVATPIPVESIYHNIPHHKRILVRLAFWVPAGGFYPVTLVCHTGAPSPLYLVSE